MAKSLKTPTSVWTKVFRRIVQQLETDANVRRVVGDNLRSWKGVPADKAEFAPTSAAPVVRLTPQPQGVEWYSPDEQVGTLFVQVEIGVQTLCIDDVIDVWDLIVGAAQPGSTRSPSAVSISPATSSTSAPRPAISCSAIPHSTHAPMPPTKGFSSRPGTSVCACSAP